MTDIELIEAAKRASENSYSPYSHFKVGAALLTDAGELYTGCNVENASYGATCCAERTAIFTAAAKGARRFKKIAVTGSFDGSFSEPTMPCGMCLQVMSEFCGGDLEVILCDNGGVKKLLLDDLLPMRFKL